MKVVYNSCFGGFSLTKEALERYNELSGKSVRYSSDIDRTDPALVKVVEELDAGDKYSDLQIRDIPPGSIWKLDEYDGNERVMLIQEYEWNIAT